MIDKVVTSLTEALAGVSSGMSIAVGGFGLCGIPHVLLDAVHRLGLTDLDIVSNDCGKDGIGLGLLLEAGRVRSLTASYVGENRGFSQAYLGGRLDVEFCPQGTLAERLRAGGAGIPAFYTAAGAGTQVAEGGLPYRYTADGAVARQSVPREQREFDGRRYVLEQAITCDVALVRAETGDRLGNLSYRGSAQNFNPLCAAAARVTIAEVERLVEPGDLSPEHIHTPGIYVQRVVLVGPEGKHIDKRVTRESRVAAGG